MNIDDVMDSQLDGGSERCAVCGKSVAGASGYARVKHGEGMVALCCPFCLEAFEKDPHRWLQRRENRRELHEIFDLLRPLRSSP